QLSHPVDEFGGALATSESDRFTPPVALERTVPRFESTKPVHGSVLMAAVITPEGKVTNVRILRSLDPVIDDRAADAFRQYKFSPGVLNGKPVYATYREEISLSPPPLSAAQQEEEQRKQREAQKPQQKPRTTPRRFPWP